MGERRVELTKLLLDSLPSGERLEALAYGHRQTFLMRLAVRGDLELIRYLLDNLPDFQREFIINQTDIQGNTPIVLAFQGGRHEAVTLLQEYGAVLPENLVFNRNQINDYQSTHTNIVHGCVVIHRVLIL